MKYMPSGWTSLAILAAGGLLPAGCEEKKPVASPSASVAPAGRTTPPANDIPLPKTDQHLCTAVAILVDTSGSMQNKVHSAGGERRPKDEIAREALDRIVTYTTQWQKSHPERALQVSVIHFSSSATVLEPMKPFESGAVRSALERIPKPGGGTAIGEALISAFESLYSSGCVRKYVMCITDGENTAGPPPDRVAKQLFDQTGGEVELHFVAFDTSASKFGFLSSVNGHVVEAADEQQLGTKLAEIYEKNILAEAMPAEKQ